MHALVVRVKVGNVEQALSQLQEQVVSRISQQPGFVAGYWLAPKDGQGLSVVVFETEDSARAASERIQPPQGVTIDSVEVREVVASADRDRLTLAEVLGSRSWRLTEPLRAAKRLVKGAAARR